MTRSHRWAHSALWPLLAILVLVGLTMALALRPPPEVEPGVEAKQTAPEGRR